MKKYVCIGEYVYSKNDGQHRYVTAREIQNFYKVSSAQCIFIETVTDRGKYEVSKLADLYMDKNILRPKHSGGYTLENINSM